MVMMVFMSLYTIVDDGFFISRLVGTDALSATNIVYPAISLLIAIGVMLATGGSAIIAKKLGEKKEKEACEDSFFLVLAAVVIGIIFMIFEICLSIRLLLLLGATDCSYGITLCRIFECLSVFSACLYTAVSVSDVLCDGGETCLGTSASQ